MKTLFLLLALLASTSPTHSQELTVAAAADLRPALDEIASKFKAASGVALRISYGSSGNFYQQIQNGAPFDVFLSANLDYPKKLEGAGLVLDKSYYEFARGSIVVIVRADSNLDLKPGLRALLDAGVKKIAIADPSHAPYGQAAVAALRSEGLYDHLAPKLVTGENISQAASFVLSGAADAGIVARSLVLEPAAHKNTRFVPVPDSDYPAIQQAMIVLRASKNQAVAMKFESYMQTNDVKKILRQDGFEVPGKATQSPDR